MIVTTVAARIAGDLRLRLAEERARWVLWAPVAVGLGVVLYFSLPAEPPWWVAFVAAVPIAALAPPARHGTAPRIGLAAVALVVAGFGAAQWRTHSVAAPVIADRTGVVEVEGRIVHVDLREGAPRVTLDRLRIERIPPEATPERVRLRVAAGDWRPGQALRLRAVILPPPGPAAPGAFDFQRMAWFDRLGGVGFAVGPPELCCPDIAEPDGAWLARLRQGIAQRVLDALPGPEGAVAAALMTGERAAIPEAVLDDMRDSGLAHLLAISGLHIGMVAGLIYFLIRAALALIPPLALAYPIKKWAAVVALAGGAFYLAVSGGTVPTQRAFLMFSLIMLGVFVDRRPISMRLVAWAALVVLVIAPETLLGPSFQMSFAAVTALVAVYELLGTRVARAMGRGLLARATGYLGAIMLSTLVATAATAPFAVYHFNRVALFGLAANMVAVPLMGLWIMPWAIAAFLLMPLGLEALALEPMGWGLSVMLNTAGRVASWPGAVSVVPAMAPLALGVAALGGIWLCLWRGRWRLAGAAGMTLGFATVPLTPLPHVLITGDAGLVAVRDVVGGLMFSSPRAQEFAADIWLRRAGEEERGPWPEQGASADGSLRCDALGCLYRAEGQVVAIVRDPRAFAEDCALAGAVVSLEPVRGACEGPTVIVDRFDLWREGSHALWLSPDGVRVLSAAGARGDRPWVLTRGQGD